MLMDEDVIRHPPLGYYVWDYETFQSGDLETFKEAVEKAIPEDERNFEELFYAPTNAKLETALEEHARTASVVKRFRWKNFWFAAVYDYH